MTKKEQIMDAAEELFAESGYEGTSVRALATKAGVNAAMISYYFGSKEQLFAELVEHRVSFLRERFQDLQKDNLSPSQKIERLIELYVDRILSNHRFHRILHRQISLQRRSELNERLIGVLMKNIEEVRKIINDGIQKKYFKNGDVDLIILTIVGTISQLTLSSTLSARVIGVATEDCYFKNETVKQRIKSYLKDIVLSYLKINNE